jgi:hypothetical protein
VVEEPADEIAVTLNRALPTSHIDRLMFGFPETPHPSAAKVWGAFVSIAMSAQVRGWTQAQFLNEVLSQKAYNIKAVRRRRHHRLWTQLTEFSRDDGHAMKSLDGAWEQARANLSDSTICTREDLKANAIERAYLWADRLVCGTDGLDDTDILVMDYVITQVEERGLSRVTCPSRAVAEHAKVSTMAAHRRLKSLTYRRFLEQVSPGWHSGGASMRRAAIYSLTDPDLTLTP